MAKSKVLCAHCDAKLTKADAFCPNCKHPTLFATVEQRTTWELEQWTSKRTTPRKKVAAMAKPKRSHIVEQPAQAREVAAVIEPIKRVRMPRTIHPTVAARAARQVPAAVQGPISNDPVAPTEKGVIVLPEAVMTEPAPDVKKLARAPKKAAALKKPEPEAPTSPAAPKKSAAVSKKVAPTAPKPRRNAPKMAPMTTEAPAQGKNGNGNGHAQNGNGNGHAMNGKGAAHDATAEQIEILRELLRRVTAIEEKMTAQQPRARRFGRRKR